MEPNIDGYDIDYYYDDYEYDDYEFTTEKITLTAEPEVMHNKNSNVTDIKGVLNFTKISYDVGKEGNNISCGQDQYFDEEYGDCYSYNEYYDYDHTVTVYGFEYFTLGYIRPVLVILTTLANVFVVGYFLRSKNRGKATSLLFVSIAISDSLTGIILIPNSVYIYAMEHVYLSEEWCRASMYMRFYFSQVLHTVSIWQTLLLGIQRYMCVCHPFFSSRLCTFWKTFWTICIIYVMAFILHVYHLTDDKVGHNNCNWKTETPCTGTCVYIWFCAALMHFVPCITLVYMTSTTLRDYAKQDDVLAVWSLACQANDRHVTG